MKKQLSEEEILEELEWADPERTGELLRMLLILKFGQ